jgi:hypothetical protein
MPVSTPLQPATAQALIAGKANAPVAIVRTNGEPQAQLLTDVPARALGD